jgi:hypothetical protein
VKDLSTVKATVQNKKGTSTVLSTYEIPFSFLYSMSVIGKISISTRLFWALPASDSFDVIG